MAPTKSETNSRHADQAKKWALLGMKLGLAGALVGAVIGAIWGFYDQNGKHDPNYVEGTTVALIAPWGGSREDVPASEVEEKLRSTISAYKVAEPDAMVGIRAPDGTPIDIPAKNLAAALRAGGSLISDKRRVSVEVQRGLDREKDLDGAKMGAFFCALGFGGLGLFVGLVPAAWYVLLVMLGQLASAVRKD